MSLEILPNLVSQVGPVRTMRGVRYGQDQHVIAYCTLLRDSCIRLRCVNDAMLTCKQEGTPLHRQMHW